mmetsp:Transcript_56655/g.120534  ORF Transcript_56655/g.120534 Transcript_56655/m.120534 type:complete len:256 (-) Transcript_56655:273-1040(-)
MVYGVIRVHRQWVGHVVVGALLGALCCLPHDAVVGGSHGVLVQFANDFLRECLHGFAGRLAFQTLGCAQTFDQAHTRADQALKESDLFIDTLGEDISFERGHLQIGLPTLSPGVAPFKQRAGTVDGLLTSGRLVQSLAHKGSERVEPLCLEDVGLALPVLSLEHNLEFLSISDGENLAHGEITQLPNIRSRSAVVVHAVCRWVRVLQPLGMKFVPGVVSELDFYLASSVDRLAICNFVAALNWLGGFLLGGWLRV